VRAPRGTRSRAVDDRHIDAFYGCPIGSLCFEIARARGPLSENAAHPFRALLSWCEDQFRKLGAGDASERYALHFVSAFQSVSLTAPVFGDADLISQEAQNLEQ
jgi:TetR/AcrR family transcriptional repressor of nem operon